MNELKSVLGAMHLAAGILALAAFWFPLFFRKGGRAHRRAGWVFVGAMSVILASAAVMTTMRIAAGDLQNAVFLGFLTLITFSAVYGGLRVLRVKDARERMYRWDTFAIMAAIFVASLGLVYLYFAVARFPLWLAFAIVGFAISVPEFRRFRRPPPTEPRWWWFEHMQAMIVAGMAAHIAFFAFGATRVWPDLYSGQPWWVMLIPWLSPFVVAFIAITLLERHYKRRFYTARA